jgi:SNF2 family DNA or RNA helicase
LIGKNLGDVHMKVEEVYNHLRKYQKEALEFMAPLRRILEYDDMGLGKTVTVLTDIESKHKEEGTYNFLILCPKNALYVWQEEIHKWFDKKSIIYTGTPAKRKKLWNLFLHSEDTDYLITTYAMASEIITNTTRDYRFYGRFTIPRRVNDHPWDAFVADEIHSSGLLNHKSKTYGVIEPFLRKLPNVYLLTGTAVRQGVKDFYAPCHIIDSYKFANYWQFVNRYCILLDTPFGKSIERRPKDPQLFRQIISKFMIHRTKKELIARGDLKDLPGKQRQILPIIMNDVQEKIYTQLVNDMIAEHEGNIIVTPNVLTTLTRLKQLLVCPKLLGINDYGASLETIVEMGMNLIENNEAFVIFTPFKQALPYIKEYLLSHMKNLKIYTLSGGMNAKEFADQWMGFQNNPSRNKVLICVIKSGSSFHATTASYGFFLGYEEDFNFNIQAEDRLCRIGQQNFVNVYYPLHKGTVDDDIIQRLNDKQDASNWIIGDQEQYTQLLKRFKILRPKE